MLAKELPHLQEIRCVLSALQERRNAIGSIELLQGCAIRGDSVWLTFGQVEELKWYGRACWLFHRTMVLAWRGERYGPLEESCRRSAAAVKARCRVWRVEAPEGGCGRRIESAGSCEEWLEMIEAVGLFVIRTVGFIDSENAQG